MLATELQTDNLVLLPCLLTNKQTNNLVLLPCLLEINKLAMVSKKKMNQRDQLASRKKGDRGRNIDGAAALTKQVHQLIKWLMMAFGCWTPTNCSVSSNLLLIFFCILLLLPPQPFESPLDLMINFEARNEAKLTSGTWLQLFSLIPAQDQELATAS